MKYLLLYLILISLNSFGQDTIKTEPSSYFSSLDYPNQGKSFYYKANKERAKELIFFSKKHIRIEECFYYDSIRNCNGNTYKITSDSTILVNKTNWYFKKNSFNNYSVVNYQKNLSIHGTVSGLIPFTKSKSFFGISLQNDTLWQEDFQKNKQINFTLPQEEVNGKILEMDQLSQIPLINKNDTIPPISIKHISLACCEDGGHLCFLSFIITSNGKLVNIETSGTNNEEDKQISLILSQYKNISPGIKKGKAFNTKYWLNLWVK